MTTSVVCFIISTVSVNGKTAYVNAPSGLHLRSEATTESKSIRVLPYGTEIEVERHNNKWKKAKLDDCDGYVKAEHLTYEKPYEQPEENKLDKELIGNWMITAYTHTGSPCANGNYPSAGYTIACNSLPFGTQVYIEGVGNRTVEDRGPDWDDWCDLFMDSYDECVSWGVQYRNVYLLK